jgi:hypothetical protein
VASDEYNNKRKTSWSQQTRASKEAGVFIANYPEYISNQTTMDHIVITSFGQQAASLYTAEIYMWHSVCGTFYRDHSSGRTKQ